MSKSNATVLRKVGGTAQSDGLGEGRGRTEGSTCRKKKAERQIGAYGDHFQMDFGTDCV